MFNVQKIAGSILNIFHLKGPQVDEDVKDIAWDPGESLPIRGHNIER